MAQLQRMIRVNATNFLQDTVLGLQSLPTEEELVKLQEAKTLEAQRRIEEERRAAVERERRRKEEQRRQEEKEKEKLRSRAVPSTTSSPSERKHSLKTAGWKPIEVHHQGNRDDDPMVQQINIIRGYIKQARQAQKWDEVQMLEENLKELQKAYWGQQPSPS